MFCFNYAGALGLSANIDINIELILKEYTTVEWKLGETYFSEVGLSSFSHTNTFWQLRSPGTSMPQWLNTQASQKENEMIFLVTNIAIFSSACSICSCSVCPLVM